MSGRWSLIALLLSGLTSIAGPVLSQAAQPSPKSALASLQNQYEQVADEYGKQSQGKTLEEQQKIWDAFRPKLHQIIQEAINLAGEHPKDGAALDALHWVLQYTQGRSALPLRTKALQRLQQDQLQNPALEVIFGLLTDLPSDEAEQLMRAAVVRSSSRIVQGRAAFALGRYFKNQAEIVRQLQINPGLARNLEPYLDPGTIKKLAAAEPKKLASQGEIFLQKVADDYSLLRSGTTTLGKAAESELFELRHLAYGKVAPDIEGQDIDGVPFKLSSYEGKVVVILFWGHW